MSTQWDERRRRDLWSAGRLHEAALQYQHLLGENPRLPEPLMGMSLIALASGQYEASIRLARAGVESAPALDAAWVTLGQALLAAGRRAEAKEAYAEALRRNGLSALAHIGLAEVCLAEESAEQALREYERALQIQPTMAAALLGVGHTLALLDRNEEALHWYEQALAFARTMPEAEFGAGFVLVRLGRHREAERRYRRAILLRPDFAAAWMNLGCLLRDEGQDIWAEAALQRAIELRPDMIAGWVDLAFLRRDQRRFDEARQYLQTAFALDPNRVDTLLAGCQLCVAEKDRAGAWAWLRWALLRDAESAEAVNMQGVLLYAEGRFAEALTVFERAERLGNQAAASNRGNTLMELGRMEDGLHAYENALRRDPHAAGARYNLALAQLRMGDWGRGWANYEARWRFREVHRTPMVFRQPRWKGEPLKGRSILLHAEQGLGDAIQFCRYARLVAALGADVILQVHAPVERLIRSLDGLQAGQARVVRLGEEPHPFDWECPLMSLPAVFETRVGTVPWAGPYLRAEPELVEGKIAQFEQVFARNPSHVRVGVAWAGNPKYRADGRRSMDLAEWMPLLGEEKIAWVSLQKGESAEQLKNLPQGVTVIDGSSADEDLAETAALVALLDLVITTDTCIAHLAGAMGKPLWILLPHLADWRWMERVETTPWYPTARLFRQETPQDWLGVLERVGVTLNAFRKETELGRGATRRGRAA